MCKRNLILMLFLFFFGNLIPAQETVRSDSTKNAGNKNGHVVGGIVENGDTLMHVQLRPITIRPPFRFKSKRQRKRYSRLVRYVKKVYPYSIIVRNQLDEIHAHMDEYGTKKEKKDFLKDKEGALKNEFEGKLRKLTYSQGRILMKLINRETGVTTYGIVKELKGSLNAFFWQSIARLFGSSLKLEYDPKGDDKMIEDIVIRIENGEL